MAFELIVYLHGAPTIWSSHLHSFAIKCGFKLLSFYILFLLDFVLIVSFIVCLTSIVYLAT